jgi:hypothetical protein
MKPWRKETLVCLGSGAAIVASLVAAGMIFGGRWGPCGPANDAALFDIAAVLPGIPLYAILPRTEGEDYLGAALVFAVSIIGYALLVLIVRRVLGFCPRKKRYE